MVEGQEERVKTWTEVQAMDRLCGSVAKVSKIRVCVVVLVCLQKGCAFFFLLLLLLDTEFPLLSCWCLLCPDTAAASYYSEVWGSRHVKSLVSGSVYS
jgi:hypothetical protein